MNLKTLIIVQILLLLVVIGAGSVLNSDLSSNVRSLHRLAGILAGVTGLLAFGNSIMKKAKQSLTITILVSLVFISLAGFSGSSLKSTDSYAKTFNTMRMSAVIALVASVGAFASVNTKSSVNTTKNSTEEEL